MTRLAKDELRKSKPENSHPTSAASLERLTSRADFQRSRSIKEDLKHIKDRVKQINSKNLGDSGLSNSHNLSHIRQFLRESTENRKVPSHENDISFPHETQNGPTITDLQLAPLTPPATEKSLVTSKLFEEEASIPVPVSVSVSVPTPVDFQLALQQKSANTLIKLNSRLLDSGERPASKEDILPPIPEDPRARPKVSTLFLEAPAASQRLKADVNFGDSLERKDRLHVALSMEPRLGYRPAAYTAVTGKKRVAPKPEARAFAQKNKSPDAFVAPSVRTNWVSKMIENIEKKEIVIGKPIRVPPVAQKVKVQSEQQLAKLMGPKRLPSNLTKPKLSLTSSFFSKPSLGWK